MIRCKGPSCHVAGCSPGRPRCYWSRKDNPKWVVCRCDCYHFPHRKGSGRCGNHALMNLLVWGPAPERAA